MNLSLETNGPALIAVFASLGGGAFVTRLAWQYVFGIKEVHAVIIDVADLNKAMEEMVNATIASGHEFEPAKRVAYYEQQLDQWLMAQGVTGNARTASVRKLVGDAVALEVTIAASLPKPPDTPSK